MTGKHFMITSNLLIIRCYIGNGMVGNGFYDGCLHWICTETWKYIGFILKLEPITAQNAIFLQMYGLICRFLSKTMLDVMDIISKTMAD
jgi:hypothetical protein